LFTVARKKWGMTGLRNPIQSMELPAGSKERTRRLGKDDDEQGINRAAPDEEQRLFAALPAEPYMAPLATLAIETAMREGELLGLPWGAVDLQAGVAKLVDTKNKTSRDVPLSPKAVETFKALPRSLQADAPIFPVKADEVQRAFKRACKAAGIANLRFHDLRHEAISRLFERGLSLPEVASISGHKTWSQLRRYTNLKAADLVRKLAKEQGTGTAADQR
jgi:integrase